MKSYLLGDDDSAGDIPVAAVPVRPPQEGADINEGEARPLPDEEEEQNHGERNNPDVAAEVVRESESDDSEFDVEYTPANSDDEEGDGIAAPYDAEDLIAGARQLFFPHIGNVANRAQDDDSDVVMEEEDTEEEDEDYSADEEDDDDDDDSGEEDLQAEQPAVDQEAVPHANNPPPAAAGIGGGLHAAHQALLNQVGPTGFQPYTKPSLFAFRVSRVR